MQGHTRSCDWRCTEGLREGCVDVNGPLALRAECWAWTDKRVSKGKLGPNWDHLFLLSDFKTIAAPQTLVNTYIISSTYHAGGISIDIPPVDVDLAR